MSATVRSSRSIAAYAFATSSDSTRFCVARPKRFDIHNQAYSR